MLHDFRTHFHRHVTPKLRKMIADLAADVAADRIHIDDAITQVLEEARSCGAVWLPQPRRMEDWVSATMLSEVARHPWVQRMSDAELWATIGWIHHAADRRDYWRRLCGEHR